MPALSLPSAIRNRTTAHFSDLGVSMYGTALLSINFLYREQVSLLNTDCDTHLLSPFMSLFGDASIAAVTLTQSHVTTFHLGNP